MPTYFQKPENALKRANEFIDVGKKERALESLYDVIKSKKHRTWQTTHEPIMEQYLELCVELRKSNVAKEGLYQYKIICQAVNINSLANVVRKYITLAEEKTETARLQSKASVLDIDDLDAPESPESVLLKAVSGEDTQARADRSILMPWVKFLWESYRQCLELLRNNSRIENLYQEIAQQAFRFCLKYSRSTEFRKLCDNLRNHLQLVYRHQHPATAINLNNPESQAMHLETRLIQLESAIKMELWQEAFKAVEDIHSLIALSKKSPKPSLMANYYQKLSLVFWKSNALIFHACSLHRLFNLQRDQRKNITAEELQAKATKVLCATLAVPVEPAKNAIDQVLELDETTLKKERHLATLLMLKSRPTRQSLLQEMVKNNILSCLQPELSDLYTNLEVTFHPLSLHAKVKPAMDYIASNDELAQYSSSLEDVIISRVVKQVSQVYETVKFTRLMELVPFATDYRLERVIVDVSKTLGMQIRIDHASQCVTFGTDLILSQREEVNEGPFARLMPSEMVRNQLSAMAKGLGKAVDHIDPRHKKAEHLKMKKQIVDVYLKNEQLEHNRLLQRRQIIESRKEQLEHYNIRKEAEEMKLVEEQRRKVEIAERQRREAEAAERELQRRRDEQEMIKRRHAQTKMLELKQSDIGAKVLKSLDESAFENMSIDDIMEKQVEQLEKERKVMLEKLKAQEKKIDYMTRAKRIKEIPMLQADNEARLISERELWDKQEKERVDNLRNEKKQAEETKARLERMVDDKNFFVKQLTESRKSQFKEKVKEYERFIDEERKKRLKERKEKRKQERRDKWIRDKEEAEQKKKDEELKREREEKEREEKDRREQEELYEREMMMKKDMDDIDARKIQRDQPRDHPEKPAPWRPTAHSGGWREKAQASHDMWARPMRPAEGERYLKDWRSSDRPEGSPSYRGPLDEGSKLDWRAQPRPPQGDGARRDIPYTPTRGRSDYGAPQDDRYMSPRALPPRDYRSMQPRMERGPLPRDDRAMVGGDDRVPLSRDERSQPPIDEQYRDARGPPHREERFRDERGLPPIDNESPPHREDRGPPIREDRGPPPRDDRGPPPRDDRGPPLRDDKGPPPREDRAPPLRDDRGPPPRDDRDEREYDSRSFQRRDGRDYPRAYRDTGYPPVDGRDQGSRDYRDDRGPRPSWRSEQTPSRENKEPASWRDERGPQRSMHSMDQPPTSRYRSDDRSDYRQVPRHDQDYPQRSYRDDKGYGRSERPPGHYESRDDRGQYGDRGPARDDRSYRDARSDRRPPDYRGGPARDDPRSEGRWRRDEPRQPEGDWRRDDRRMPPREAGGWRRADTDQHGADSARDRPRATDDPVKPRPAQRDRNQRDEGPADDSEEGWQTVRR